ncbi:formate/nitrite transporter family protein [soil metagenome]
MRRVTVEPDEAVEGKKGSPDDDGDRPDEGVEGAFERSIDEGERRLRRSWPDLFATGAVGGLDVGVGVFALLLVFEGTGNELLGALAFGIGFVALTLGNSELFTEDFLVPVTVLAARRARLRVLLRLWSGTAATNLLAGWLVTALVVVGFPYLEGVAIEIGRHYPEMGIGSEAFASAILGGAAITLMTWMERGTDSVVAKLVAAWSVAFILAAGAMNHAVVASLGMFAALHAGAPFGYLDWLGAASFAALGNMIGGIGLVTLLRLVQVGGAKLEAERQHAPRGHVED